MEQFSEEHSKCLLSKEWLVKTDNQSSTPYLFKFYSSTVDLSCCLLLTDTKSVWTEVLTSKQIARRWRDCNNGSPPPFAEAEAEDEWRTATLELLSKAHTLGGIADISFEVVESNYADFAFELECDSFKWRWETCFLGHKRSAEIISKHLILPLISISHLAFSSPDVLGDLSDADIEKAVDKVGRIARRTVDTHIKNAISKPRVASTLRRMTAMFNFITDLPPVISTAERPDLQVAKIAQRSKTPVVQRSVSPRLQAARETSLGSKATPEKSKEEEEPKLSIQMDSATESEGDEVAETAPSLAGPSTRSTPPTSRLESLSRESPPRRVSPLPSTSRGQVSDSDSSPVRPAKKLKKPVSSSSDDDSEEERKRRVAQLKSGGGPGGVKRGTRQPVKRGGKRF
ncbi:hypothetical protein Hypma_006495 [Hypsizygus marmoreus]|uniref:XLF-like N-terminal domain-containing protein n=1 Tax=Hypsizygus marmoreus TaxID=39966 RepID=A0A369JVU5_HYPMA|nr:hypothetical protein Hypma_006495 [Hypsizygus marmoreus]